MHFFALKRSWHIDQCHNKKMYLLDFSKTKQKYFKAKIRKCAHFCENIFSLNSLCPVVSSYFVNYVGL